MTNTVKIQVKIEGNTEEYRKKVNVEINTGKIQVNTVHWWP